MNDANLDLDALAGFLEHLDPRDAAAAAFARHLLDAGAVVRSLWGPVQMDVRELTVQRGDMIVRFGVERGFSDGVLIGPAGAADESGLRPLALAVFAWARANGIPLQLDDPDRIEVDLVAVGIPALDWVGAGNDDAVDRVHRAWLEHRRRLDRLQGRTRGRPSDVDLRAVITEAVAALEAAAPRAVPSRPTQSADWSAVRAAEEELLTAATRRDPSRVRELLHPDFIEIGRSGRLWTRDEIVAALAQETGRAPVVAADWLVAELASDLALVTYTVVGPERGSRHSSLWAMVGGRLQLRFHQGTYIAER